MPDTRFSLAALKEHLRKYLAIYLVVIVAALFGSDLLWTTTRPQLTGPELIKIYLTTDYSNPDPLSGIAADMLAEVQRTDEAVKSVEFESLYYTDPNVDYNGGMVLMTRLAVGEGDAFLAGEMAIETLCTTGALLPMDDLAAQGWLSEYGLEPYYFTYVDEETGESGGFLAGLRLDDVDALAELGVMNNQGAVLCLADNGDPLEPTLRALEVMMKDLTEASHAGTENTQPSA